jgi:hypothetical protein
MQIFSLPLISTSNMVSGQKNTSRVQAKGIIVAKGKQLGRPQISIESITHEQLQLLKKLYIKWKQKEITGVEFMTLLNLKKNTFYKLLKQYEESL